MSNIVVECGGGMVLFAQSGHYASHDQMAAEAARLALADAGIGHRRAQQARVGCACGDSTVDQRLLCSGGLMEI